MQLALDKTAGNTWDLITVEGQLVTISGSDYIAQKAKQILLLVKGEWFLDTTIGIPYFQSILVKNPDIPLIESILVNALRNDTVLISLGVTNAEIVSTTFDKLNRQISFDIDIITDTETVSLEGVTF
jgi:hypothetical protein